jgi:type IV secretion system protein VirD4
MDRSWDQRRVPIFEPAELRRIEQRKALVLAEMYDPIIANLHRCIDGKRGKELLAAQKRARLNAASPPSPRCPPGNPTARTEPAATPVQPIAPTEPVARTRQRLGMPK